MSSAVDALLGEIDSEAETFTPQLEGLRDFDRLNLETGTEQIVQARVAVYERRLALLASADQAIQALAADGHPGIPDVVVDRAVFDDLSTNVQTISAAFDGFEPQGRAASATVTFGAPRG